MAFAANDSCVSAGIIISAAGVGSFQGTALQSDPTFGVIMSVVSNVLFNDGAVAVGAAPNCRKVGPSEEQVISSFLGKTVQFQLGSAGSTARGSVVGVFKLEVKTTGGQDPDTNVAVVISANGGRFLFNVADLTVVN
jgi:hypothetical protein